MVANFRPWLLTFANAHTHTHTGRFLKVGAHKHQGYLVAVAGIHAIAKPQEHVVYFLGKMFSVCRPLGLQQGYRGRKPTPEDCT